LRVFVEAHFRLRRPRHHARRRHSSRRLALNFQQRAVWTKPHFEAVSDFGHLDALAIDEQAVAALKITNGPATVAKRDDGMPPTHLGVLNRDLASLISSDVECL